MRSALVRRRVGEWVAVRMHVAEDFELGVEPRFHDVQVLAVDRLGCGCTRYRGLGPRLVEWSEGEHCAAQGHGADTREASIEQATLLDLAAAGAAS